jgi:hypothetical protein
MLSLCVFVRRFTLHLHGLFRWRWWAVQHANWNWHLLGTGICDDALSFTSMILELLRVRQELPA